MSKTATAWSEAWSTALQAIQQAHTPILEGSGGHCIPAEPRIVGGMRRIIKAMLQRTTSSGSGRRGVACEQRMQWRPCHCTGQIPDVWPLYDVGAVGDPMTQHQLWFKRSHTTFKSQEHLTSPSEPCESAEGHAGGKAHRPPQGRRQRPENRCVGQAGGAETAQASLVPGCHKHTWGVRRCRMHSE
jgi:hypothetical protein